MNTAILGTYGLEFRVSKDIFNSKIAIVYGSGSNPITPYIQNYLMGGNYIEFYEDEIIPEINKAINGQGFDPDGGGEIAFFKDRSPFLLFIDEQWAFSRIEYAVRSFERDNIVMGRIP